MRAVFAIISLLVYAALAVAGLFLITTHREAGFAPAADAELNLLGHAASTVLDDIVMSPLERVKDATISQNLGQTLSRLEAPEKAPAPPPRRGKAGPGEAAKSPPEARADLALLLKTQLTNLASGPYLNAALVNARGEVVGSVGNAWPASAQMRNSPLVYEALGGIAQLNALDTGKETWLLAAAPTSDKDGVANGVLLIHRVLDKSACDALGATLGAGGAGQVALFQDKRLICATGSAAGQTPGQASGPWAALDLTALGKEPRLVPVPSEQVPLFVDATRVGWRALSMPVPKAGVTLVGAIDMRPRYAQLSSLQSDVMSLTGLLLLAGVAMIVIATMLARQPAQTLAEHMSLFLQGNHPEPLNESRFAGPFRHLAKTLNEVLERAPAVRKVTGQHDLRHLLAPPSAEASDAGEADFRFEPAAPPLASLPKTPAPQRLSQGGFKVGTPPPADAAALQAGGATSANAALNQTAVLSRADLERRAKTPAPVPLGDALAEEATPVTMRSTVVMTQAQLDEARRTDALSSTLPPLPSGPAARSFGSDQGYESLPPLPALPPETSSLPPLPALSDDGEGHRLELTPIPSAAESPWGVTEPGSITQADPDEAHFHEVFDAFVRLRIQCGESVNNLTFDKFIEKLKKSREQVMQKQNCKTVRFQVYAKDGKAALKAVASK